MRTRFLLLLLAFPQLIEAQKPSLQALIIPEQLKENAHSVVREEITEITISAANSLQRKEYRVVTVLDQYGVSDVDAYLGYDDATRVTHIEATIYDAFGNEIKRYKKRDFKDVSAVSGGTLYSDSRVKYLDYAPSSFPFTVVFETEIASDNTAFLGTWVPNSNFNSSTEKSVFRINYPPSLELRYNYVNPDEKIRLEEGNGYLEVTLEDYAALAAEPLSPPLLEIIPNIQFALNRFYYYGIYGETKDWKSFGTWVDSTMLNEAKDLKPETVSYIKNLVKDEADMLERARLVYDFMQDKTRYISVQLGIGGWQPMLASEVDALGYGDCKALTNYTQALLAAAEVPSYYTLIFAGASKKSFAPEFATMQGNHAILAIPVEDNYIWLECTSQTVPFGFLGNFTDDRDVLVITPDGGEIAHTQSYLKDANYQRIKGDVYLEASGTIRVQTAIESGGIQYDDRFYLARANDKDRKEYYFDFWEYLNGITMGAMQVTNDERAVQLKEEVQFSAASYASLAGNDLLFNPNILNRYNNVPQRDTNREFEVQILRGFVDDDKVVVHLPNTMELTALFDPIAFETEFGSYSATITQIDEKQLEYQRHFELNEFKVPKEKYEALRKFLRKVRKSDSKKIILTKK